MMSDIEGIEHERQERIGTANYAGIGKQWKPRHAHRRDAADGEGGNLPGLKRELSQGTYGQDDLHSLLIQACYMDRQSVVDMLVDHHSYTTDVLARIVVDALDRMQAEFAFHLLGHDAFRERALNPALHEAADRKDEGDLEAQITALIKAGADTSSRDKAGRTALEITRCSGYVTDTLAGLLQPGATPATAQPSMAFTYTATPLQLPPELVHLCLNDISAADRETIGAASGTCQNFYLLLMDKRKKAQALHSAENLDSVPLSLRAGRFHHLLRFVGGGLAIVRWHAGYRNQGVDSLQADPADQKLGQ